jgi:hypothetical protein
LLALIVFGLSVCGASAQTPINIEQLIAKPARWQLGTSVDYRTTNPGDRHSTRSSAAGVRLRYGLSPRFEINAGLSRTGTLHRRGGDRQRASADSLSLGVNGLLTPETRFPAVLFELRANLESAGAGGRSGLAGGQVTLTAYKSLDPVVLSLSASAMLQRGYRLDGLRIDPGSAWRVDPTVNFAVNPQITLLGGLSLARRHATRLDGQPVADGSDRVALLAGIGYALSRRHTLFVNAEISAQASSGASLQWFYQF